MSQPKYSGNIVDAHFHIWDLSRFPYLWPDKNEPKLFRTVSLDEYSQNIKGTPVRYSVFLHVLNNCTEETEWVLDLAKEYDFVKGVVAGLDLLDAKLEETVLELKKDPRFVGCRHILDFEENDWLLREDVHKGLAVLEKHNLTFDLLLRPHLLQQGLAVIRKFPRLKFVVDHIAKPYIKDGKMEGWKEGMQDIASHPNVYCKVSGLVTEADLDNWKMEDFIPYIKHIVNIFGAERCIYGSDWPVCTKANADYERQLELARTLLSTVGLSQSQMEAVFYKNAISFYGLKVDDSN